MKLGSAVAKSRWVSDVNLARPSRQSRSLKTQDAILDAAEALFSEHGLEATSVLDVARQAGVSVGAVYHHFRDKKALFCALLDRLVEDTQTITKLAVGSNPLGGRVDPRYLARLS